MSPLFFTLKSNLEFAIRCKDKVIYDIVIADINNSELTSELTTDEIEELYSIACYIDKVETLDLNTGKWIEIETPKACLLDDPTCESCSS